MQAKRLLSCGFAFLFIFALAGVSSAADVSDARGTWVRIERPADGAWAAIGDTVIVAVHTVSSATALTVTIKAPDGDDDGEAADDVLADGATALSLSNSALDHPGRRPCRRQYRRT